MQLTLRHLRYFRALVETEHFGRAAQTVGVTQPALSARIAELEAITGLRLAERHARGASITDAGQELAKRAAAILAASSEVEAMADAYSGRLKGTVRLGIIPSVARFVVPTLLARAKEAELTLSLRESVTERLLAELGDGKLDAVLASAPLDRAGVVLHELGRDRFVFAAPPGSAADATIGSDELPPLVLLEEGHCLREQALAYCQLGAPQEERGVASLETLVAMVAGGACTTLLPELYLKAQPSEARRLRIVRLPDPQPARSIVLAWRRTDPRDAQFAALAEEMIGWFDLVDGGRPSAV